MPAFLGGDINVVSKILHKKHFFIIFLCAQICVHRKWYYLCKVNNFILF